MNQVTGELIHLKMEQLEGCRAFPDVAADFVKWCGNDYVFCTWGNLDITELQVNMDYYNMTPVSQKTIRFLDIQKLFSIAFEDKKSRRTLQYAVDFLGIGIEGAFHRAYADAYYTAQVIKNIHDDSVFLSYSFDTYCLPRNKSEEIKVSLATIQNIYQGSFRTRLPQWRTKRFCPANVFYAGKRQRKRFHGLPTMAKIIIPLSAAHSMAP